MPSYDAMLHHYIYAIRFGGVDGRWLDDVVAASEDDAKREMRRRYGQWALLTKLAHQYCVDVDVDEVRSGTIEATKDDGADSDAK